MPEMVLKQAQYPYNNTKKVISINGLLSMTKSWSTPNTCKSILKRANNCLNVLQKARTFGFLSNIFGDKIHSCKIVVYCGRAFMKERMNSSGITNLLNSSLEWIKVVGVFSHFVEKKPTTHSFHNDSAKCSQSVKGRAKINVHEIVNTLQFYRKNAQE